MSFHFPLVLEWVLKDTCLTGHNSGLVPCVTLLSGHSKGEENYKKSSMEGELTLTQLYIQGTENHINLCH